MEGGAAAERARPCQSEPQGRVELFYYWLWAEGAAQCTHPVHQTGGRHCSVLEHATCRR